LNKFKNLENSQKCPIIKRKSRWYSEIEASIGRSFKKVFEGGGGEGEKLFLAFWRKAKN